MQFVKIFYLIHHTFAPFKITNKNLFFQNFSFSFFSFFFFQKFIFFLFKFFSKMKHLHHTIPRTHPPPSHCPPTPRKARQTANLTILFFGKWTNAKEYTHPPNNDRMDNLCRPRTGSTPTTYTHMETFTREKRKKNPKRPHSHYPRFVLVILPTPIIYIYSLLHFFYN